MLPVKIAEEVFAAQEPTRMWRVDEGADDAAKVTCDEGEDERMGDAVNRRWCLAKYPEGIPGLDTWRLETQEVPQPGPRQILVKAKWLSVDPYMRGRMSPAQGYTKGAGIGEVMPAAASARSSSPTIPTGSPATLPTRWPSAGRNTRC
jgi:hypothetical protein